MNTVNSDIRPAFPLGSAVLDFELPPVLEAGEPPEARGLRRDEVRLMISYLADDRVIHTRFNRLVNYLRPGDVLVINTSGTMNAALPVTRADGLPLQLHLSTLLPNGGWTVEVRQVDQKGTTPFGDVNPGTTLPLPAGGQATLLQPYCGMVSVPCTSSRLWRAELELPTRLTSYLDRFGSPIRYSYVNQSWPLDYYQTVFSTDQGSAEMPSAGRAFTPELVTQLVAAGIQFAPLLLHTGVASLEHDEPPYEEFYRVPATTADLVNRARAEGRRVIAVGTTAVRALETVAASDGTVSPGEGWTGLVITPERKMRAIDGLLTGLHEPQATHLAMLAALSGSRHLKKTYREALQHEYLWHEFGDLHLILPHE